MTKIKGFRQEVLNKFFLDSSKVCLTPKEKKEIRQSLKNKIRSSEPSLVFKK